MRHPNSSGRRGRRASALSLIIFVVALFQSHRLAAGLQGPGSGEQHEQAAASAGPMMSLGAGETSSALESASVLGSDDLIAAESSQAPDMPAAGDQHKAFTSAQILRQEPAHMSAASVAPIFQGPPQQQQHQHQQAMYQQAPHMAARLQPPHKANFNPFMAAALAGNYGPAQQQIAAAALHAQQQGGQVGPPQHQHHHPQQQQQHLGPAHPPHPQAAGPPQQQAGAMHPAQQQQQAHHHHQHHHASPMGPAQQQAQLAHMAQPQQQHQMLPPQHLQQQLQPGLGSQAGGLAVQESSIRHNVVPPPPQVATAAAASSQQFGAPDSSPIELNEIPASSPQQQQQTGLAVASSVQHSVIAPAGQGVGSSSGQEAQAWPLQAPDIPKIVNLEVKCEKNLMKVSVEFDKSFNGVIFSKGHFNQGQCVHVGPQSNKQQAYFDISINSCGTQGNTQNGLYGMGQNTGSGTFFENTIVIQYDPNVQEVYDHARKLRCTWHDQYEKAVTFRPFPVDMLDIVRADFAGDNVGCWMQIQVGKGPWASEVAGIVKIGQTMTMVLAIKDEENKFDMLVRNCFAHDGKRGPIELVDKSGCITRPKLMSRFTKIKNFGSSATVLSYAHFQAFKFPDSMEVHFQCTIQICRHQCPEQCAAGPNVIGPAGGPASGEAYSESTISGTFNIQPGAAGAQAAGGSADSVHLRKYGSPALSRERRDAPSDQRDLDQQSQHNSIPSHQQPQLQHRHIHTRRWLNGSHYQQQQQQLGKPLTQSVGVNRIIQVVSTGDLAFAVQAGQQQQQGDLGGEAEAELDAEQPQASQLTRLDLTRNQICMSSYNFVLALVMLVLILLCSCMLAISLYVRQRSLLSSSILGCKPHKLSSQSSSSLGGKLIVAQHAQKGSPCQSPHQSISSNNLVPSKQSLFAQSSQFYTNGQPL